MNAAAETRLLVPDSATPRCAPDFARPLQTVLGLPFDAIGLDEAVERVRDAAFGNRRLFLSTPNLNFAMSALRDPAFRDSVLRSDMSLVDGMPLVWAARLGRLPVRERVSGADLFEALRAHPGPPLRVFLFGGPPGAAARACAEINEGGGGVRCVGHDAAGFGSVEAMSEPERIERINRSDPHFVVVALGAGKGQAWIEHNAARLAAPVLSHLGAVVNFAAGTVRRAPSWMQLAGLEWAWRIREEPQLWRRYVGDGLAALRLLVAHLLPDALDARRRRGATPAPRLRVERPGFGQVRLGIDGDWRDDAALPALRAALQSCADSGEVPTLDLGATRGLSSPAIALLLVASGWFRAHGGFAVGGASPALRRALARRLVAAPLLDTPG